MKKIALLMVVLTAVACRPKAEPVGEQPIDTTARTAMRTYSLEENIGQMLMVGFRGTEIDSTHHVWRDLRDYHAGAVILFDYDAPSGTRGRNIKGREQLAALCAELREASSGVLIGIDQEGGNVSRMSRRYGFRQVRSHKYSAQQGIDSVRQAARTTAEMLSDVGVNLNFAPVADVDVNPRCPVIGGMERSFSANEEVVAECCRVWIEEQTRRGVASCMKHFPGHGSASGDTHKGMVDVSKSWQRRELEPYRQLAHEVPMVMTAHVVNRQIDASGLPASLSPAVGALLRDSLGFEGVIVTDDLAMGAVSGQYAFGEIVRMAIEAGADILCLSNNGSRYDADIVPRTVAIIKRLVKEGRVSEERIEASAKRVRRLVAQLESDTSR